MNNNLISNNMVNSDIISNNLIGNNLFNNHSTVSSRQDESAAQLPVFFKNEKIAEIILQSSRQKDKKPFELNERHLKERLLTL